MFYYLISFLAQWENRLSVQDAKWSLLLLKSCLWWYDPAHWMMLSLLSLSLPPKRPNSFIFSSILNFFFISLNPINIIDLKKVCALTSMNYNIGCKMTGKAHCSPFPRLRCRTLRGRPETCTCGKAIHCSCVSEYCYIRSSCCL